MPPAQSFRDLLTSVKDDVTEVRMEQVRMNEVLNRNTVNLAEHMRRTENLESRMAVKDKRDAMWDGAFKLVVVLGAAAGAVTSVFGIWKLVH